MVANPPQSTSIWIAAHLRERIIEGRYAPGQQLNETKISSEFRSSRGPLREALMRLSQEGLLISKPNRGVFVADLTGQDFDEIYRAREVLELGAAELITAESAARRKQISRRLAKIAARLSNAADAGDWNKVLKLDLEFHTTLVSESGNSRLLRAYETLVTETLICATQLKRAYPAQSSLPRHLLMADLIATGSLTEIRSAFHRHLSDGTPAPLR